jgi:hypothetical protein
MQFKLNFTNGFSLVYNLVDKPIAKQWANLISQRNISECCSINHFMGWTTDEMIQEKINRLYELTDYINSFSPGRVIKQEINRDTWRQALQVMHVHFPEMKNDEKYRLVWDSLTEYNDVIHWLESAFIPAKKFATESSLLRLTLDFNKTDFIRYDIPDDAYELFDPFYEFGVLQLHYVHIGKHANEMFAVNDFECPKEQFVPQRQYSASVRMLFYDYFYRFPQLKQVLMDRWKKFYEDKGGKEFWGLDIEDPKMAFGFCKIGQLSQIFENENNYKLPETIEELHTFRSKLIQCEVVDWEIKGA